MAARKALEEKAALTGVANKRELKDAEDILVEVRLHATSIVRAFVDAIRWSRFILAGVNTARRPASNLPRVPLSIRYASERIFAWFRRRCT